MNIFALSKCPHISAKEMIDKHVVKMPTETCQMLHTNILYMQFVEKKGRIPKLRDLKKYHEKIDSVLMKPAMLNHPSTIWSRQSKDNFDWLFRHGKALCKEYSYRYNGKEHGSEKRILDCMIYEDLIYNQHNYEYQRLTPVLIAMDDKYRIERNFDMVFADQNWYDEREWKYVIKSYRHYYLEGKWRFAEWKMNRQPSWWPKDHIQKKDQEWNDWLESENERIRRANNV